MAFRFQRPDMHFGYHQLKPTLILKEAPTALVVNDDQQIVAAFFDFDNRWARQQAETLANSLNDQGGTP